MSMTSGGPYNLFAEIPYSPPPTPGDHYTSAQTLVPLPGEHTYYFVLVAFANGASSADSNEASITLTGGVPAPQHFILRIRVQ